MKDGNFLPNPAVMSTLPSTEGESQRGSSAEQDFCHQTGSKESDTTEGLPHTHEALVS